MINRILHKLFLTCKEATYLMELKEANSISLQQNVKLKLHLVICKYCRLYLKKVGIMNDYLESHLHKNHDEVDHNQINKLKNKILDQTLNSEK